MKKCEKYEQSVKNETNVKMIQKSVKNVKKC